MKCKLKQFEDKERFDLSKLHLPLCSAVPLRLIQVATTKRQTIKETPTFSAIVLFQVPKPHIYRGKVTRGLNRKRQNINRNLLKLHESFFPLRSHSFPPCISTDDTVNCCRWQELRVFAEPLSSSLTNRSNCLYNANKTLRRFLICHQSLARGDKLCRRHAERPGRLLADNNDDARSFRSRVMSYSSRRVRPRGTRACFDWSEQKNTNKHLIRFCPSEACDEGFMCLWCWMYCDK